MLSTQPIPYKRTLLLDSKGDLCFDGSGKLRMTTTDAEKRSQDIMIYMKTVRGEDMYNRDMGFDIMAAKRGVFSAARIEFEIRKAIEQYRNRPSRPNRIKEISSIVIGEPDADRSVAVSVTVVADTNTVSQLDVNL